MSRSKSQLHPSHSPMIKLLIREVYKSRNSNTFSQAKIKTMIIKIQTGTKRTTQWCSLSRVWANVQDLSLKWKVITSSTNCGNSLKEPYHLSGKGKTLRSWQRKFNLTSKALISGFGIKKTYWRSKISKRNKNWLDSWAASTKILCCKKQRLQIRTQRENRRNLNLLNFSRSKRSPESKPN